MDDAAILCAGAIAAVEHILTNYHLKPPEVEVPKALRRRSNLFMGKLMYERGSWGRCAMHLRLVRTELQQQNVDLDPSDARRLVIASAKVGQVQGALGHLNAYRGMGIVLKDADALIADCLAVVTAEDQMRNELTSFAASL